MSEHAAVILVSVFTAVECHLFADCDDAHVTGDTYGWRLESKLVLSSTSAM